MKTELALMLQADGPLMTLEQVADLLEIAPRSLENNIYAQKCPIPMFKVGSKFKAHVRDVAQYIDSQRDAAMELLQQPRQAA